MAVGNVSDQRAINDALVAQAQWLGDVYATAKRFLIQWQVNVPSSAALTAAGFTQAADQAEIEQFVQDLAQVVACIEGAQVGANQHNMIADIAALRGVAG